MQANPKINGAISNYNLDNMLKLQKKHGFGKISRDGNNFEIPEI